jgi:small subunit ribosomal protein S16
VIEELGYYDPSKNPAALSIKKEKIEAWVKKGAQLSPTVKSFLKK